MKIAILNHRKGTGKTTTAIHLGSALYGLGKKSLLFDLDPQGSLTSALFDSQFSSTIYHVFTTKTNLNDVIRKHHAFDVVPADIGLSGIERQLDLDKYFCLRESVQRLTGYDIVLFDCPPSLGLLTFNAMISADYLLIPVTSHDIDNPKGLDQIIGCFREIVNLYNPNLKILGILFTRWENLQNSKNTLFNYYTRGIYKFNSTIRFSAGLDGLSINAGGLSNYLSSAIAVDYKKLAKEILDRVK